MIDKTKCTRNITRTIWTKNKFRSFKFITTDYKCTTIDEINKHRERDFNNEILVFNTDQIS